MSVLDTMAAAELLKALSAAKLAYAEAYMDARSSFPGRSGKGASDDEARQLARLKLSAKGIEDPEVTRWRLRLTVHEFGSVEDED